MSLQKYRELAREAEASVDYWSAVAINDFARELNELREHRGITNSQLARRIGKSRQYVSKLLGGANVTLGTMVRLAMALSAVVRVRLEPREDREKAADDTVVYLDQWRANSKLTAGAGGDAGSSTVAWGGEA